MKWKYKIKGVPLDIWENGSVEGIVSVLKRQLEKLFNIMVEAGEPEKCVFELQDIILYSSAIAEVDELDEWLDLLYDWGDRYRVWIAPPYGKLNDSGYIE